VEFFKQSPRFTPRRHLDETRASRTPVLKWKPESADGDETPAPADERKIA
jgi:hypothetical protein